MARTKQLGDIAEAAIMADVLRRGYRVALPYGEDWPFDLLVLRNETFERVQCKYGRSNGRVLTVSCRSSNNWVDIRYTKSLIDWLAVHDSSTGRCFYIPAEELGTGMTAMSLRVGPTLNKQAIGIRWAETYAEW